MLVALHVANVTETTELGESRFLRAVRDVPGPGSPFSVTLDMHDKIFDDLAQLARIAVSYRTYFRGDMAVTAQGLRPAGPHHAGREHSAPDHRPPVDAGGMRGRAHTFDCPMRGILARTAAQLQARDLLHFAVNAGFTDADLHAAGPLVLVAHGTG